MAQNIQNGISSLENLFAVNNFQIPQYQRAFSWESDPHLEAFLEDLRQQVITQRKSPGKHYYLGTFLLHKEDLGDRGAIVNIVDGQQRMTTSVVFIATALALHEKGKIQFSTENPALLKRYFVYDGDTGLQKFQTIQEDQPYFQSEILGISSATCVQDSPSSRRLKLASQYFINAVSSDEWESLISVLRNSKVMVYAVDSPEDATQIFELQNDRGKSLTNLEALKSFLMHSVYLHSPARADEKLAALQTQFSKIFRIIESFDDLERTPDEDQLLANHCTAYLKWTEKEECYNPKRLVKSTIKSLNGAEVVPWIEEFVSSLVQSYQSIKSMFDSRDNLQQFSELLLLGRMGSYWPIILKTWWYDHSDEHKDFLTTCRLLEVFTFRGYAISNLRSDTSLYKFYSLARDFSNDFPSLFNELCEMSHYHNMDSRFVTGLESADFYQNEGSDALYLLWRYENSLRSKSGQQQSLLSWRDFVDPRNYAAKFSVEHIAARESQIANQDVAWDKDDEQPFHKVALNRLGNLVIDSISSNASKGNKDFIGKQDSLSKKSIYLSQGELIDFLQDSDKLLWDVESIRKRHQHLVKFAETNWDPNEYHTIPETL